MPGVIENGEIVDAQYNWKSRGYDTVVLAASITIANDGYFMALVIRREPTARSGHDTRRQRHYVHEVMIEKISADFKTGQANSPGAGVNTDSSMGSLLYDIVEVKNGTLKKDELLNRIFPDEGRFSLKTAQKVQPFDITKDKILENMKMVTGMSPVVTLDGSGFKKQEGRSLSQAVMDYYGGKEFYVNNPTLGDVKVGKRGIKAGTQHKLYGSKIEGFKALREVIEDGYVINVSQDYKNDGTDRVILAAPIEIDGKTYYMGAVVNRTKSNNIQNYYIHDVVLEEKNNIPKDTDTDKRHGRVDVVSPYNILQQLNNINNLSENDVISDEGRFSLKDSDYLEAVKRGDMETAQRMVDEAAKPEQIKNIDNENPTDSSDIRYLLKDYDKKQIKNWGNSKKIIIYENPQQLKSFVDEARQGKAGNKKIYFGVVPDDLAKRVLNETDIDISNRNVALGAYEIQKILKDHGDEDKEATRGQRAITADDFSHIRDVIESPDTIELDDKLYNGRPIIKFTKVIGSKNTVVTYDSVRSSDLRVQTMYIGQNKKSLATVIDEQASINTPEATSGTALKSSITDDGSKSNTQYSYPDESDVINYANEHETEFVDVPPVRDYERKQRAIRQQTYGELLEQVEKLKRDKHLTKGKVLDEKSVREELNNLVSTLMTYSESYTASGGRKKTDHRLVSNGVHAVSQIFTSLKKGDSYEAITTAELAAKDIVEKLELINDEMFYTYKELRDYLKNTRIVISEEDAASIPDFKEFKKEQAGRIRIVSQNGVPVDTVYPEIIEKYPELFSADITHPADQLIEMADVRESLEPYDIMLSAEETEQLVKQTAQDLLDIAGHGKAFKSWADKKAEQYDEKLRLVKARHKEALRDIRRNERERAERLIQGERQKWADRVNRANERGNRRVQEEKGKAKAREAKKREEAKGESPFAKWKMILSGSPTDF